MCALLVGFGIERIVDGHALLAATAKGQKAHKQQAPKTKSGKKVTAKQALDGARKAFAAMIKSARADKGLDPKTVKNKPFWLATKKLAKQLDRAQKGLAAKNDEFFKAISDARAAEEQMKIDWQLTDSKNKQVIDDAKKLGHALAVLRTDFSKEAARKKKGGELSAKEKEAFAKIKAQQQALLTKVKALEGKAKKDKGLEHGLKRIAHSANKIVKAPDTVDGFVATLYLVDEIEGMLYGYDYYVDKEWRGDWINVETVTTEWEATYTEIEVSETYEWTQIDESVEIYTSEEYEVSEEISEEEIQTEETWAESESVEMSEAEEEEVAAEEDSDAEVESDNNEDEDSMDDDTDDEGEDFDGDGSDDAEDDSGGDESDDGGDDGGSDDDGGEE
jgi:hypothetical protein